MQFIDLTGSFIAIAPVALLLGVKHGLDADHLAAIDGLTRFNSQQRPRLAKLSGTLFSLGHGVVVVTVALVVSTVARSWQAPQWLGSFGAWMSIAILTLLGLLNIRTLLRAQHGETAQAIGWRSLVFSRLLRAQSPAMVMGVGVLFALSFDTMSQAALFAVAGTRYGGWQAALVLAVLFVAGMLVTDGLNGMWIARLMRHSDETALIASRFMTVAVSGLSLVTAGVGATLQIWPALDQQVAGMGLWLSTGMIALVFLSFVLGRWMARRELRQLGSSHPADLAR